MAIKIVCGYNDPEWDAYEKLFYDNFNPDDWDYIIEGDNEAEVVMVAEKLYVCDFDTKKIGDKFYSVTYHA